MWVGLFWFVLGFFLVWESCCLVSGVGGGCCSFIEIYSHIRGLRTDQLIYFHLCEDSPIPPNTKFVREDWSKLNDSIKTFNLIQLWKKSSFLN